MKDENKTFKMNTLLNCFDISHHVYALNFQNETLIKIVNKNAPLPLKKFYL